MSERRVDLRCLPPDMHVKDCACTDRRYAYDQFGPVALAPGNPPIESPIPDESNPKDALGMKKPPLRLIPPALMIEVSRVMGLGAKKYGPFNWRSKKVRRMIYLEAALRHILQAIDGEDADPESGRPHEAHAAACMGIILDAKAIGTMIDDRPIRGAASRLIVEMTETTSPSPSSTE